MPWVNREGRTRTRSGYTPPSGFTAPQLQQLAAAGWEWVEEVPLNMLRAGHDASRAALTQRQAYARRWASARADQQMRADAVAALRSAATTTSSAVPRGRWVNEVGQNFLGGTGTRHPDTMEDNERDARIAAGYRWVDAETWSHPTLRAQFLRSFDQDGEQARARERIAERIRVAVPSQTAQRTVWVNRDGEVYREVPGPSPSPTQMRAAGWHRTEESAVTVQTRAARANRWLVAEVRARLAEAMENSRRENGAWLWLDALGYPHPTFRREDAGTEERRSMEDAGYRRVYFQPRDLVSVQRLFDEYRRSTRTTAEGVDSPSLEGAWINALGQLHHIEIPPRLAGVALRAELQAAGYVWVGGNDVRTIDASARAEVYQQALLFADGRLVASTPAPAPPPAPVATPVRISRSDAWTTVQQGLMDALAAVPSVSDGPAAERRVVIATLGRLIYEVGDHTIPNQ